MILRHFITGVTALCLCGAALTGCSRSPRVSFYTLGDVARTTAVSPSKNPPSVSVADITVPDMVNRPQLVERVDGNRVEILETHRWAEPLKNGISRILADSLASRLESVLVTAYPQNPSGEPDYRVVVDIRRFESMGDAVSVDAIWSVRRTPTGVSKPGRTQVRETRGGGGYEAVVAAYNRAIDAVGSDIAGAIRTDWAAGR
jgi:uncharacterized lipoprotein YmbA